MCALVSALSGAALGAASSARQLAEPGPTHDRMVMIETYLAQFGLKNLNPLSMTFDSGKVEVHGKPLNGKLTCGENIADLGGLKLAYKALVKAGGKEAAAPINGFTPTQRFFLAWAQLWRRRLKVHPLGCARSVSAHALPRAGRA